MRHLPSAATVIIARNPVEQVICSLAATVISLPAAWYFAAAAYAAPGLVPTPRELYDLTMDITPQRCPIEKSNGLPSYTSNDSSPA